MGTPDACDATPTCTSRQQERLAEAYRRYDLAYADARPGTRAAVELARARLDLVLLLEATGAELPEELLAQVQRDADSLVLTSAPLDLDPVRSAEDGGPPV